MPLNKETKPNQTIFLSSLASSKYLSLFYFLWFSLSNLIIIKVGSSAQDLVICLCLRIPENFMDLIVYDGFWFVHISFSSMVRFRFLAQFPVNQLSHPVMSCLMLILSYLPPPPLGQDMTQGQFFKRSLTGLNSEFSFSWTSCLTKAEEPGLPYYLPIAGGRITGFIPFAKVLVLCEMQSVSSMIWTHVAVSISYDDNHYTTGSSLYLFYACLLYSLMWLSILSLSLRSLHFQFCCILSIFLL